MLPRGSFFAPQPLTALLLGDSAFSIRMSPQRLLHSGASETLKAVPSMEAESWGRKAVICHPRPEVVEDIKGRTEWWKAGARPGPIPK